MGINVGLMWGKGLANVGLCYGCVMGLRWACGGFKVVLKCCVKCGIKCVGIMLWG